MLRTVQMTKLRPSLTMLRLSSPYDHIEQANKGIQTCVSGYSFERSFGVLALFWVLRISIVKKCYMQFSMI